MEFQVGELYGAQEIQRHLAVGNAGGIRVSLDQNVVKRVVVLTVVPTAKVIRENPYHDRIEGDVLAYSGGGLRGDQTLAGTNKRLPEQATTRFPIYGFRLNESRRKAASRRWEFLGLLQFLRVYPDNQIDGDGSLRRVWLFDLRICSGIAKVRVADEQALAKAAMADYKFDAESESREDMNPARGGEIAVSRRNAAAIERIRAAIFALDPREFELLVRRALEASGFVDVSVTRFSQDNGIDVNARVSQRHWPIAGARVQVQAKRWLHTVGRREVAELRGSLTPFAYGAVVTTSCFSKAAIAEAGADGRAPIVLVNGYCFAEIARTHGLISSRGH